MGHYLIIRLLKIEDNGEFKLRDTIDDVKIKKLKLKKYLNQQEEISGYYFFQI